MKNATYDFSAKGTYQWCRRGSDYSNAKYRSLLVNSVGVFLGLIIALIINETTNSSFPSAFILPALAVAYAVYFYAYYRTKQLRKQVKIQFTKINYSFGLKNNQLFAKDDSLTNPVPLFAPDGYFRVTRANNKLIIAGLPNLDLLFVLENSETAHSGPAYAYRDFVVELSVDDEAIIEEITNKFAEVCGPPKKG